MKIDEVKSPGIVIICVNDGTSRNSLMCSYSGRNIHEGDIFIRMGNARFIGNGFIRLESFRDVYELVEDGKFNELDKNNNDINILNDKDLDRIQENTCMECGDHIRSSKHISFNNSLLSSSRIHITCLEPFFEDIFERVQTEDDILIRSL